MPNPPSTGNTELDAYLSSVRDAINTAAKPVAGWKLSDFHASVSEVISEERDLIDIVTAWDDLVKIRNDFRVEVERYEALYSDSKTLGGQYEDYADTFSQIMEWWDQNYKVIQTAQDILDLAGKDAYQVAVRNGFEGTEAQWVASLKGEKGNPGAKGNPGPEGKDAYQVALDAGFVGTREEWLVSIKGPKGDPGNIAGLDDAIAAERAYVDELVKPRGNHGNIIAEVVSVTADNITIDFPNPISGEVTVTLDILSNLAGNQALVGYKFRGPNGEKALEGMGGLTYSSSIGEPYRYVYTDAEQVGVSRNWSYTTTPDEGWTLDGLVIRSWNQGSGQVFISGVYTDDGTPPKIVTRDLNNGIAVPVVPTSGASATARNYVDGLVAVKADKSYVDTEVGKKADSSHQHPVTDLTATGTRSATTYLRGDGSWVTPTNTTYSVPSQAEAQAGTATTGRAFSAQRVAQAIDARAAAKTHSHTRQQVTGLDAALDEKAPMPVEVTGDNWPTSGPPGTIYWQEED